MLAYRRIVSLVLVFGIPTCLAPASLRAQELERPPLPDYLQVAISESLELGKNYLMRSQQSTGTWATSKTHAVGYAALPGLTLLELGVPAKDPQVQRAAQFVRAHISLVKPPEPVLDNTYEVALAVLFLDRLGDPRDKGNIQKLIARLIAGQTHTGGWSYKVPLLPRDEDTPLILGLVKKIEPLPLQELLGGRLENLDNPFVKNWPRKAAVEEQPAKARTVKIPSQLVNLPVLNEFEKWPKLIDPENAGQSPTFGTTDNSTTQFGLLALWAGRRHGIPATRTGTLAFMRYHTSQNSAGGWGYRYVDGGSGGTPSMINPGLLGLAVGHGLVREMKLVDEPAVDEDPRIHRAFLALSNHIGTPEDRIKDLPMPNLYFLWSIERVAVLYKMHLIGNKDWYRWGAEALVANQDPETGMWEKSEYAGGNGENSAPINTSFALLFLKRANLAEDLSAYLTFSPKKLNDNVVKLMPKQVAKPKPPPPKAEPKVEEKPVVVAEAKPPAPAPTPVVAPPPQMSPRPAPTPPPPEPSGTPVWVWVLVGVGVLLILGGVLAVVLMARGGGGDDDEDEEEERPRPKKKPRRR